MSTKPVDALTANHFYIEMAGLVSPHFQKIEGISKKSGEVVIIDGSTNTKHKFSDQLKEVGDITLTRVYDGSVDDITMRLLVEQCLNEGFRFDINMVKMHNGQEAFRIIILGMRIKEVQHPNYDTGSTERLEVKYVCSVSDYVEA